MEMKVKMKDDSSGHDDEDDPEEKDLPEMPASEEHRIKRTAILSSNHNWFYIKSSFCKEMSIMS